MTTTLLGGLGVLSLELGLLGGIAALLVVELFLPPARKHAVAWAALALLGGLLVASFFVPTQGTAFGGAYEAGAWAMFFKRLFLVAGMLGVAGASDYVREVVPFRQAEYFLLLLFSVLGMMLLPGVRDLLLLLVCFELMGVPLYLLAAYRKTDARDVHAGAQSAEAGLKYYLVGAASTVTLLFGAALLAGVAGTTRLEGIVQQPGSALLVLGGLMVIGGMGFKLGAAPFHMWMPDTYQGASTPFVAFLSVAPKAAGVAALSVLFARTLQGQSATWLPPVLALAFLSITVGSLFALPQSSAKRLLAFSGVAQVGYVLLGLATGTVDGLAMVLFYLAAYVVANLGVLLAVHAVAHAEGSDDLSRFDGLAQRSPGLALALLLLLLSLAGIPFVAGFWAKLYVFTAVLRAGHFGWALFGAVLAVVGLFYYLRLVRAMYMVAPASRERVPMRPALAWSIATCALLTVGLGAWPGPLLEAARRASAALLG